MDLATFALQLTKKDGAYLFGTAPPRVGFTYDADGDPIVAFWNVPDTPEPTSDDLKKALAEPNLEPDES